MAVKFTDLDLSKLPFSKAAVKVNNVLTVPLDPIIKIQTDLLTTTTPLCDENNELLPSVYAKATGPFLNFMKSFETAVLTAAKDNASTWWPKPVTPTMIDNGYKSYFRNDETFKLSIRQSAQPIVFDAEGHDLPDEAAGVGAKFWAVLEAQRLVLGKQEFGIVWKLNQMMLKPAAKCEIRPPEHVPVESDEGDFL